MLEVNQNSYISLVDANTYFEDRLYSEAWSNTPADDKEKALIMATKKIDRQILAGYKSDLNQTLKFPRYPETVVNKDVLDAVCEEALAILSIGNSNRVKLQRQGVQSFSVGSVSESYTGNPMKLLSQEAKELLRPYILGSAELC
jgi:hypothetical protein